MINTRCGNRGNRTPQSPRGYRKPVWLHISCNVWGIHPRGIHATLSSAPCFKSPKIQRFTVGVVRHGYSTPGTNSYRFRYFRRNCSVTVKLIANCQAVIAIDFRLHHYLLNQKTNCQNVSAIKQTHYLTISTIIAAKVNFIEYKDYLPNNLTYMYKLSDTITRQN